MTLQNHLAYFPESRYTIIMERQTNDSISYMYLYMEKVFTKKTCLTVERTIFI